MTPATTDTDSRTSRALQDRVTGADAAAGMNTTIEAGDRTIAMRLGDALLSAIARVPNSNTASTSAPMLASRAISQQAARRAAMAAGSLALPPGPLGWITIIPELIAIWRIQSQLVADIAASYGRSNTLGREKMLYCMFRHLASQTVRDLAIVSGQRLLFKPASMMAIERIARRIGLKISQQAITRGIARWIPVAGAVGVGAWAYYDTQRVARTTIELFEKEVAMDALEAPVPDTTGPALRASKDA